MDAERDRYREAVRAYNYVLRCPECGKIQTVPVDEFDEAFGVGVGYYCQGDGQAPAGLRRGPPHDPVVMERMRASDLA